MAKTPYVQDHDLQQMFNIAAVSYGQPLRNVAMLHVIYGTGMTLQEVAKIPVKAYLRIDGRIMEESAITSDIAFNANERPLYWTNSKLVVAIDAYLAYRIEHSHMLTTSKSAYRRLDPDSPIFLTDEGGIYKLTKRITKTGAISYSCDSLSQLFRKMHAQAGIAGASAESGRRTCAIRLTKQGASLDQIMSLFGLQSLRAARDLVDIGKVHLGAIAARVF
ncbi:site-specific integrase [Janthinobacterium sp. PAMC25594]|uniref:site-specific integrase n=1 Tax=Janthinobacterium sp. PAMC25594 TaxID=2861284 RepID=UPI001C639B00|nr:site-specific integrase [Janthinobacterium sp. PAMC25594]QYG06799.1 site-specific integrase [Janthinobacterium sp. PAMC25594]